METSARKSFTASRGYSYSYIHKPAHPGRLTLLFLHGFPSHLLDWVNQVRYFGEKGYGVIAPDLLGYGRSSKPDDAIEYRFKPMSDDIAELLQHLDIEAVVGIGHDFGANFLGRFAAYHPTKLTGVIFLAVGSGKPGKKFDIDMINSMTKRSLGFEMFGYISWLGGEDDPHLVLEQNAPSAMNLLFANDHSAWNEWFHPLGKMQQFVQEDRRLEMGPWFTPELQHQHLDSFTATGGYKGATRWYRMLLTNASVPDERELESFVIQHPTLFIGDPGTSAQQEQMLSEWVEDLHTDHINSGHWLHLEKPHEVNRSIESFLLTLRSE